MECDLAFLVILPSVSDRHAEMVRLQACMSGVVVPSNVLVFPEPQVEKWGKCAGDDTLPGTGGVPGAFHPAAVRPARSALTRQRRAAAFSS